MSTDTKAALLDAAKRLIAEQGYAGTSVRDLVAVSGANLAAVSYHFGSREQLLNLAVLDAFVEWTDRLVGAAGGGAPGRPGSQMAAIARTMLDELPETEPLFAGFLEAVLQARRAPELKAQLADHYADQRGRVGEMVHAGAGEHHLPDATVDVVASVLIAVVDGLQLQSLLDPHAVPTSDALDACVEGLTATATATVAGR